MLTREEATAKSDTAIEFSRVFDAPRELVFRAWTEPELYAQWFAPEPFTTPIAEIDLRPGGRFKLVMRDPDGKLYPSTGEYLEVDAPERFVATDSIAEMPADFPETLNALRGVPADTPIADGVTTVTFEDLGDGRTKITFHEEWESKEVRDAYVGMQMVEGLDMTLDHLERLLPEWQA